MRIAPQNDSEDLAGGDSDWQRDNLRESLTRNGSTKPAGSRWGKVRDQASKLVIDGGLDPEVVLAADGGPVPQFATRFSEGLRQFATQFEPLTVCAREPAPVALRGHCRRPLHFSAADRRSPFSLCRAMARRQHPAACDPDNPASLLCVCTLVITKHVFEVWLRSKYYIPAAYKI